jgi:hypothetical protein
MSLYVSKELEATFDVNSLERKFDNDAHIKIKKKTIPCEIIKFKNRTNKITITALTEYNFYDVLFLSDLTFDFCIGNDIIKSAYICDIKTIEKINDKFKLTFILKK